MKVPEVVHIGVLAGGAGAAIGGALHLAWPWLGWQVKVPLFTLIGILFGWWLSENRET